MNREKLQAFLMRYANGLLENDGKSIDLPEVEKNLRRIKGIGDKRIEEIMALIQKTLGRITGVIEMIKQVAHPTLSEIFSINNNVVYRIPKYQREYTWGINNCDALFNDVTENDFGYFLGSYICVNNGSLGGTTLELIDGQQRFTTIILLLTAVASVSLSWS